MTNHTGRPVQSNTQHGKHFRLITLGRVSLVGSDGHEVLGAGVPLALLTYVHCSPGQTTGRDHLTGVFWATSDQGRARQALRQNLTRLRGILGPDAFQDEGSDFHLATPIVSDYGEFLDAVARQDYESAVANYGGPFFPEFGSPGAAEFEHWVDAERQRLHLLFLRVGEHLVRRALDRGRAREGADLASRLVRDAPDSEVMRRLLLEVRIATADGVGARVEADALVSWLKEEGRAPEPATARLIRMAQDVQPAGDDGQPGMLRSDLVGREREFHRLVAAWREAARGPVRHLHLEGRPGLGKTRLLEELSGRVRTLGGKVVSLRAQPGERHVELTSVADLVRALCDLPGAKAISEQSAALIVGLHPALGSVFPGVKGGPSEREGIHPYALALADLVTAVAEESPLALLLDDAHWMDEASSRIAAMALTRLGNAPVLVVTAGRPGASPLGAETTRILLGALSLADTESLLASLAAFHEPSVARQVAAALHLASGGIPLLVLETLQFALDEGQLQRVDGLWQIPDVEGCVAWVGRRNALEARLESLTTNARTVLLTLAATGVPLARQDLERARLPGTVSPVTLAELERRGYITLRGDRCELAHDEIGDAVLRLGGDTDHRAAHVALGRALVAGDEEDLVTMRRAARHLRAGEEQGDLRRLFVRWTRAARRRGDHAPAADLAGDLLGANATNDQIGALVRALPVLLRWPRGVWWGIGTAFGLAIVLLMLR
jgi:DNA-binding SARP family transcriptional activator